MSVDRNNPAPAGGNELMPGVTLRRASETDFSFAQEHYLTSMKPLLISLDAWDEATVLSNFKNYFNVDEIRIIRVDDFDAGWIQVSETREALHLDQIHLNDKAMGRGIGSVLIKATMDDARNKGKPVLLSLVRGNRALGLYERLGFRIIGDDQVKFHMRWDCD